MRQSQARRHGGHSGTVPPQMTACAPATKDCVPKKLTGSELVECKSRLKTPELVFTARIHTGFHKTFGTKTFFFGLHLRIPGKSQEFQDHNQNLCNFLYWKHFFWSSPFSFDPHSNKFLVPPCPSRIHMNKFLVPQNLFFPPVTLSWRRAWAKHCNFNRILKALFNSIALPKLNYSASINARLSFLQS